MPIPPRVKDEGATCTILALFGHLHEEIRHETKGMGTDALDWMPAPGANSIATIVTHLLGSEAETLRARAGFAVDRDTETESDREFPAVA